MRPSIQLVVPFPGAQTGSCSMLGLVKGTRCLQKWTSMMGFRKAGMAKYG